MLYNTSIKSSLTNVLIAERRHLGGAWRTLACVPVPAGRCSCGSGKQEVTGNRSANWTCDFCSFMSLWVLLSDMAGLPGALPPGVGSEWAEHVLGERVMSARQDALFLSTHIPTPLTSFLFRIPPVLVYSVQNKLIVTWFTVVLFYF